MLNLIYTVENVSMDIRFKFTNQPSMDLREMVITSTRMTDDGDICYEWSLEAHESHISFNIQLSIIDAVLNESSIIYMAYNRTPETDDYDLMTSIYDIENQHIFIPDSEVNQAGDYLFMFCSQPIKGVKEPDTNFTMISSQHGCRYWNAASQQWKHDGCSVSMTSSSVTTVCLCNHLTSFGSSFYVVPPNSIDFDTVFENFTKLSTNPSVFATVFVLLSVYFLIMIWARCADRHEQKEYCEDVIPLVCNNPTDKHHYEISITTGLERNAGTTSKVYVKLYGKRRHTNIRRLSNKQIELFRRGSRHTFLLSTSSYLDDIRGIHIWHDNSGFGQRASWLLAEIQVRDIRANKCYNFPCFKWCSLGDGNRLDYFLTPWDGKGQKPGQTLMRKARQEMIDGHLWVSVVAKPYDLRFTRIQRVSCCLTVLFTSMLASAMWYQSEYNDRKIQRIRLGPLSFTWHELYVGMMSALVVLPINLIIVEIFRRSAKSNRPNRGKTLQISNCLAKIWYCFCNHRTNIHTPSDIERPKCKHALVRISEISPALAARKVTNTNYKVSSSKPDNNTIKVDNCHRQDVLKPDLSNSCRQIEDTDEDLPDASQCRHGKLPSYFTYIGWILVLLSNSMAAFFIILYSLEWGHEKSIGWLKSIAVSFLGNVFIIQPIKVVVMAFALTILPLLKHRRSYKDEKRPNGDRYETKHSPKLLKELHNGSYVFSREDELKAIEQYRKHTMMGSVLREIMVYFLFLLCLLCIAYNDRDLNAYNMKESLENIYFKNPTFKKMKYGTVSFWDWTSQTLLPGLYPIRQYNGRIWPDTMAGTSVDMTSYRTSQPRIIQLRIRADLCSVPGSFKRTIGTCNVDYSTQSSDTGRYSKGWRMWNSSFDDSQYIPWKYTVTGYNLKMGFLTTYTYDTGGGYVAHLGDDMESADNTTVSLMENKWIDRYTRALFINYLVYNVNINLFGLIVLLVEYPTTGGIRTHTRVEVFRLHDYIGGYWVFIAVLQLVFVGILVYYIITKGRRIYREKAEHFKRFWNWVEILQIALCVAGTVTYLYRVNVINTTNGDIKDRVNMGHVTNLLSVNRLYSYILAFTVFITIISFFKLLRFNYRMSILHDTIIHSSENLMHFAVFFAVVFLAHVQFLYFSFGHPSLICSDFLDATTRLFSLWLDNKYEMYVLSTNPALGALFMLSFVGFMYVLCTNIFITAILSSFSYVTNEKKGKSHDIELIEYTWSQMKSVLGITSTDKKQVDKENLHPDKEIYKCNNVTLDTLEDIHIKLQKIDSLINIV